jgi:hypothetical protein
MQSITDQCTQQWVVTIYTELRKCDHFKKVTTEILRSPQFQSQVLCSIYEDRFSKNWDEILSAHFLQYAVMAANLTPKLYELETIDPVGGH